MDARPRSIYAGGRSLGRMDGADHDKYCYPPTIINVTDGEFNGTSRENILQLTNELKAMFTNDGNVLLWNIHVKPDTQKKTLLPTDKGEVAGDSYAEMLYDISSMLSARYARASSRHEMP